MDFHPIADEYPLMTDTELSELAEDIKANGQHQPVWLYEGKVLDGRNRWRACEIAGVKCATREYKGDDPSGFAESQNIHRKHYQADVRRRIVEKLRGQGMSTRQIAEKVGTDHKTIVRDLGRSTGENAPVDQVMPAVNGVAAQPDPTPQPERVTGKDGKSRPARRTPEDELEEQKIRARDLRDSGQTQRQIAEQLGVSQGTVSRYLSETESVGNGRNHGKRMASGKAGGESIDWIAVLRWAAKKGRVTADEIKDRWNITQKSLYQRFNSMELSQGYIVRKVEDDTYRVSRAVHMALTEGQEDLKGIMKSLLDQAKFAYKTNASNSSTRWNLEEQQRFLLQFMDFAEAFTKG